MLKKAYLEITNVCNMDCSFCHKTAREGRVMSEDEFELLTDRLRGKAEQLYFHLMGEPTLHPLLPKFVRRAREKGFLPIITTNGTLLARVGEALIAAAPYKVSISLHAPAANAAFADAAYLDNCISFARRAAEGGAYLALRLWNLGGDGEGENAAILSRLHAEFDGEWVNVRGGASQRIATRIFLEWGEHFDWPDLCAPASCADADAFCYGLRDQIGVLCDGTVVPCCLDSDGILALGNLLEEPLEKILHSPRATAMSEGFACRRATEPLCQHCGYAERFV
jgi:MoaA/NifB/PqqE/SkfB family radical SAM enzyme